MQRVFERYEKKYIVPKVKLDALRERLSLYMEPDRFDDYTISNIYYDTDQYDLIRASIEKPIYKEKLRLRSYGGAHAQTPVHLELKKKYQGIVYKRTARLTYTQAKDFLESRGMCGADTQTLREIRSFLMQYPLSEKIFLSYRRNALCGITDKGLRVTFDTEVRFRQTELHLDKGSWGTEILDPATVLMEIKFLGAMPVVLSRDLSALGIFPASFSKYGTCYQQYMERGIGARQEVMISA